jgi:hypothetical protein
MILRSDAFERGLVNPAFAMHMNAGVHALRKLLSSDVRVSNKRVRYTTSTSRELDRAPPEVNFSVAMHVM